MSTGWVVEKFEKEKDSEEVFISWEKGEVLEKADELNETAPIGTWYGWRMNR